MRKRLCWLLLVVVIAGSAGLGWPAHGVQAQGGVVGRLDVFVDQAAGMVYFVDALTGLSTAVDTVGGQHFTLVGDYVLFEKRDTGTIMRARSDGTLEPHPFIRRRVGIEAVYWVVSPDARAVAWVLVDELGGSEAYVAWADGSDLRQLPIAAPQPPLTLMPVALTNGMTTFFYDMSQPPPGTTAATPFTVYHHVAAYDLEAELFTPVPLEPNCPCDAAITPDGSQFARLEAANGIGPFALSLRDLAADTAARIAPPGIPYALAGDTILNSRGTLAIYSAAAAVDGPYALVMVDTALRQQVLLFESGPVRYRPLRFIDDDTAVLLASMTGDGTYKLALTGGTLQQVSRLTYLGAISTTA